MTMLRRFLLITKALKMTNIPLVIEFASGIITLNTEGNGNKTGQFGSEVILNG